jgi:hypothetical protein
VPSNQRRLITMLAAALRTAIELAFTPLRFEPRFALITL